MVCKHWSEYDAFNGRLFEYCSLVKKSCYCCGTLKQCSYPNKSMPIKTFLIRLLRTIF